IVSSSRRAPAAIAEERASTPALRPSAGSATTTLKSAPRPCRSAIASASPAKPAPAITTSAWLRSIVVLLGAPYPAPPARLKGARLSAPPRKIPRISGPGAVGSEPVPRPQPAGAVAAGVRRTGDRPGARRRLPHRRRASAPFAARLFPPARRPGSPDHLRGRPHSRRQELRHPARGRDPARARDFHHVGLVSPRRARPLPSGPDAERARPGGAAERERHQEPGTRLDAGAGAALLRARAPDRVAASR